MYVFMYIKQSCALFFLFVDQFRKLLKSVILFHLFVFEVYAFGKMTKSFKYIYICLYDDLNFDMCYTKY